MLTLSQAPCYIASLVSLFDSDNNLRSGVTTALQVRNANVTTAFQVRNKKSLSQNLFAIEAGSTILIPMLYKQP